MTAAPPVVWVDVESTGLDPDRHEVWEVGLVDAGGTEHRWCLPVDLGRADPVALKIGRFHERHPDGDGRTPGVVTPLGVFAREFARLTAGAVLAGAVVSFDEERLRRLLRANGACPAWSHRVLCVETLAAGLLRRPVPVGLAATAALLEVDVDEAALHTAVGDARLAEAVYRRVMAS